MSIEQQAESAARDIASWVRLNAQWLPSIANQSEWTDIIARHMQPAIDKAMAPLKERIEELEANYLARCRDHAWCNARIVELEGLGPLIEQYGSSSWNDGYNAVGEQRRNAASYEILAKINAILKGDTE